MKTTVEQLSPTRSKLTITVTPEDLQPSIKHAYEHIGSQVQIPGFRKGKVPAAIIDQRVGRAEVMQHAVSDGLDRFYRQAVQEERLRPVGRPEADITQLPELKDFSGDLVITVEVDVRPEFEVPKFDVPKFDVPKVELPKFDLPKLPKVDVPSVDVAALQAQAEDRAARTAKTVSDNVTHTVALIREAVGAGHKPAA